jgi:hypothetical protein
LTVTGERRGFGLPPSRKRCNATRLASNVGIASAGEGGMAHDSADRAGWEAAGDGPIHGLTSPNLIGPTLLSRKGLFIACAELRTRSQVGAPPQECCIIHYGDVRVGTISSASTAPPAQDHWKWACGFYPDSHPRECTHGSAASFEEARAGFEVAWQLFLASRTEADFKEYRHHHALDRWKHAMWDAGLKLPTQVADGRSTCFCGASGLRMRSATCWRRTWSRSALE